MNTIRYARWMEEAGWMVKVFCVNGSKLQHTAVSHNLKTISIKRNKKYVDLMNAWRVYHLFKQHDVSLCWFRDTRDFSLLGWVKRLSLGRIKLLYQQAMQLGISKRDIAHTIRFRMVDAWVSTLEFLAQQVRKQTRYPHSRIHVIPLGVDEERLLAYDVTRAQSRAHFHLKEDIIVLGIIGRLDRLKGQHVAIEAMHLLHEQGKKVHLLIVGESTLNEGNHYEQELKLRADELELHEHIHFAPYTKKVELFYHAIDIFLLCSKGETFGTVTIEAMAFGKPVIGTNSIGTPEILNDECGLLVTPEDENDLAEKITLLLNYPALQLKLIANAHKKFEQRYSKKASVIALETLVKKLIGNL